MIDNLTAENFDSAIAEGNWVIDFWATWCGPCRMQGKLLENGAEMLEKAGIKIGKVNTDEEQELAVRFGILSIPTLLLFRDGTEAEKMRKTPKSIDTTAYFKALWSQA